MQTGSGNSNDSAGNSKGSKPMANTASTSDSLAGKVIAVTGAASGMGFTLASLLVQRGALISIADVTEAGVQSAAEELKRVSEHSGRKGDSIFSSRVDVREPSEVRNWINETVAKFGRLDGAANVAGVIEVLRPKGALWHEAEEEDGKGWDWVIGVNLTGVANCMKAELKHMRPGAAIVNVASISGLRAAARSGIAYTASKHGVVGLTRAAAREYGPQGIRINAVAPGTIETAMMKKSRDELSQVEQDKITSTIALRRTAEPDEVAKVMMFLLSNEASYVTGSVVSVDGAWD